MSDPKSASQIIICGSGPPVPDITSACPQRDNHTPSPSGYTAWFEWAARMVSRGSVQKRCPTCRLYACWTPTLR